MPAINTPVRQILKEGTIISLSHRDSMKTSRYHKLHCFPYSVIPKAPLILTTLELVSTYDCIKYLGINLSNTLK